MYDYGPKFPTLRELLRALDQGGVTVRSGDHRHFWKLRKHYWAERNGVVFPFPRGIALDDELTGPVIRAVCSLFQITGFEEFYGEGADVRDNDN
jgi:hypothetical protein